MTHHLLGEKERQEIIKNSPYKMHNKRAIMEKYNVSMRTAERAMKQMGLFHTSPQNIECILRYKNGEKVSNLIKEYNMSQANLNALMRFRGIEQRGTQYCFNFHYFDEIDTEDKAYFLGFIYADGNVFKNSLKITIRDYDVDILEKFKAHIEANHPIRTINANGFSGNKFSDDKMVEFIVTKKELVEALEKHGVVPNKTHKIDCIPDTLPDCLFKHFLRGYIDGDGSFGKYKHNDGYWRFSMSIVGTESFLLDLSDKVRESCDISFNGNLYDRYPERNTNTKALTLSGKKKVVPFLDWLYQDSAVWLNRKFNKYKNMIM